MRFSAYSNDGDCAGLAQRLLLLGSTVDTSVVDVDVDDSTATLLVLCSFIRCILFSSSSFWIL